MSDGDDLQRFLAVATGMQCSVHGCPTPRSGATPEEGSLCLQHQTQLLEVVCATTYGVKSTSVTRSHCVACHGDPTRVVRHTPQVTPLVRAGAGKGPLAGYYSNWCAGCHAKHLTFGVDLQNAITWSIPDEVRAQRGLKRIARSRLDLIIVDDMLDSRPHRTNSSFLAGWFKWAKTGRAK